MTSLTSFCCMRYSNSIRLLKSCFTIDKWKESKKSDEIKLSNRCCGCTKWLLFNKEISKLHISYVIWGGFELNPKLKYVLYNKFFILLFRGCVHFNPCVFIYFILVLEFFLSYFILVIAFILPTEFDDLAKD